MCEEPLPRQACPHHEQRLKQFKPPSLLTKHNRTRGNKHILVIKGKMELESLAGGSVSEIAETYRGFQVPQSHEGQELLAILDGIQQEVRALAMSVC